MKIWEKNIPEGIAYAAWGLQETSKSPAWLEKNGQENCGR